jgi:putative PIN family toxin of toxin-antitoxin system
MIKVVLDTNVIISGLGWKGNPREIIKLWEKAKITFYISAEILNEYIEVLERNIIPAIDYKWFVRLLEEKKNIEIVKPQEHFDIIKEDPDDNIFLDCGITGNVKYIITGDDHLLNLKEFKGIKILTPADFLEVYKKGE